MPPHSTSLSLIKWHKTTEQVFNHLYTLYYSVNAALCLNVESIKWQFDMVSLTRMSFATWLFPLPGSPLIMITICTDITWKLCSLIYQPVNVHFLCTLINTEGQDTVCRISNVYPFRSRWSARGLQDILNVLDFWLLLHSWGWLRWRWVGRHRRRPSFLWVISSVHCVMFSNILLSLLHWCVFFSEIASIYGK